MKIQPFRTVIVGCGMISDAYLCSMIRKFKILEVVGCCNRSFEKAQEKAEKYRIHALTMEEILADDSIEIVVNLTPPPAHYTVIKQLLEADKHVYTEKVLTVELGHAAELVEIARQRNLYLGAAPDTFLGSAIQTARYVVESGMIGDISSCYCALSRDYSAMGRLASFVTKPGGGIGFDVGIYYLTALLSILGPVKEVSGTAKTRKPTREILSLEKFGESYTVESEDIMAGTIQFDSGVIGTMIFDSNSVFTFPEKPSMVIFGTMGVLYMADPNQFGGAVRVVLKGNNEPFVIPSSHAFDEECRGIGVAEMAWSIRQGRKHRANEEMAYHALEILHGIVKSGESKSSQVIFSTFEKPRALPRGYRGQGHFQFVEENSIIK